MRGLRRLPLKYTAYAYVSHFTSTQHFTDFTPGDRTVNGKDKKMGSLSKPVRRPPDSRPATLFTLMSEPPLKFHCHFTVPVTGGPLVQRHRQDPACGLAYFLSRPALAPEEITW